MAPSCKQRCLLFFTPNPFFYWFEIAPSASAGGGNGIVHAGNVFKARLNPSAPIVGLAVLAGDGKNACNHAALQ
jgi:hypothetical protein